VRKISFFLVIIFSLQSWSKADDISDFQIEGISIGDSLLDYYSLQEIKVSEKKPFYYPKSKKFKLINFYAKNKELFDTISFSVKDKDENFIIYGIKGAKDFSKSECLKQKEKVIKQVETIIPNFSNTPYIADYKNAYGNSKAYANEFLNKDGSYIRIWCSVWDKSNKIVKDSLWEDALEINVGSKTINNFLNNEAFQ